MRVHELQKQINDVLAAHGAGNATVMIIDSANGMLFSPAEVVIEQHDDVSSTVWIKVEEF